MGAAPQPRVVLLPVIPMGPSATSVTSVISLTPVGQGRVEGIPGGTETVREAHSQNPSTPAVPHVCVVTLTAGEATGRASKPSSDFLSALSREVHETRNHLRMVGCSVAAYNTEAQGAQESLSQVRDGQGHGRRGEEPGWSGTLGTWGLFPASGQACPWPSPSTLWLRRSLTSKCVLSGDLRLWVTARTELPEC